MTADELWVESYQGEVLGAPLELIFALPHVAAMRESA
jgi:hypothetical protein